MQDAQGTRYQTAGYTELPCQSQKKARTPLTSLAHARGAVPSLQPVLAKQMLIFFSCTAGYQNKVSSIKPQAGQQVLIY